MKLISRPTGFYGSYSSSFAERLELPKLRPTRQPEISEFEKSMPPPSGFVTYRWLVSPSRRHPKRRISIFSTVIPLGGFKINFRETWRFASRMMMVAPIVSTSQFESNAFHSLSSIRRLISPLELQKMALMRKGPPSASAFFTRRIAHPFTSTGMEEFSNLIPENFMEG